MSELPIVIAVVTWALAFAAGMLGMSIGQRLPEKHRTEQSGIAIWNAMGIVSTLTAIALGLLISVANGSFREKQDQLMSTSSDLIRMDHLLRMYGPEADGARQLFKDYATSMMQDVFSSKGGLADVENEQTLNMAVKAEFAIASFRPSNETQRWLQPHMLDVANKVIEEHFELVKQRLDALPGALTTLLLIWLALLFVSYGLYTPRHLTSVIIFMLSTGAASGAVFLILELETPHRGVVYLSPAPLQHAVNLMNDDGGAPKIGG